MKTIAVKNSKISKEPSYISELYPLLYKKNKTARLLDDNRVQSLLTLGCYQKILEDILEDVGTNSSVLQVGCTFGNQIEKTADKIGRYGKYVIVDVIKDEIERVRQKMLDKKIDFEVHDARIPFSGKYDTVLCLMLLHELPEISREKVINNILDAVKSGGRAIFVDYHKPNDWNLIRFVLKPFNRLFFPFTEGLWKKAIKNYAQKHTHFSWYKKTYRSGMYQKIVAVRHTSDEKKPETKPSFY